MREPVPPAPDDVIGAQRRGTRTGGQAARAGRQSGQVQRSSYLRFLALAARSGDPVRFRLDREDRPRAGYLPAARGKDRDRIL